MFHLSEIKINVAFCDQLQSFCESFKIDKNVMKRKSSNVSIILYVGITNEKVNNNNIITYKKMIKSTIG